MLFSLYIVKCENYSTATMQYAYNTSTHFLMTSASTMHITHNASSNVFHYTDIGVLNILIKPGMKKVHHKPLQLTAPTSLPV